MHGRVLLYSITACCALWAGHFLSVSASAQKVVRYENASVLADFRPELLSLEGSAEMLSFQTDFHLKNWERGARTFEKVLTLYAAKMVSADSSGEPRRIILEDASGRHTPLAEEYIPVSASCEKTLNAYASEMPEEMFHELRKKCRKFGIPGESGESASRAEPPGPQNPGTDAHPETPPPGFRCTPTQVFTQDGKLLYQDPLPENLWKMLQPPDTRDFSGVATEKLAAGDHFLFYSAPARILYARMGTPVTFWPERQRDGRPQGYLVAMDIRAEGRLMWMKRPETPEWSFAGAPLADETRVYVPMMRQAVPPEFHLAAMDARTGAYLWRRFLFTAVPGELKKTQNPGNGAENANAAKTAWQAPAIFFLPLRFSQDALCVGGEHTGATVFLEKQTGKIQKITLDTWKTEMLPEE